jgi:inner membrane protein
MPTVFSHAVVGLTLATVGKTPGSLGRLALVGALCAVAPDLDVVGLRFGIPWRHVLGHRGLTHSVPFAAVLAAVLAVGLFRGPGWNGRRGGLWLALFLATASHGVLDAMTTGGPGVAFFAPFDDTRYFLPWRPIPVSPLSPGRFFSQRGVDIMQVEIPLLWLPAAVLAIVAARLRARRRGRA